MKAAAAYQRDGMSRSEAIKKAYSDIGYVAKSSSEKNQKVISQSCEKSKNDTLNATNKITASFKKIGGVVAAAFSVAAIKSFGKECISNAARVQAANAQLDQTFGELKDSAVSSIKKVADESGILDTRLQGVGTSIYAFAKASGMDSATALNMMKDALTATADSAAYYDRSLEDTAESLKSFLKGNYANDAALGISCTETTRNTVANRLYGKSFKDLTEAQKQLALLQMVKDANALSGAMGQAAREADGWENVTGNLKESWNQLLAVVGKPILQGAVGVIKAVTSAISRLTEYAKGAVSALSDLFGWNKADTTATAQTAKNTAVTATSIEEAAGNQENLTKQTKKTAEAAKGSLASFDKLNVLTQSKADSSGGSDSTAGSTGSGKSPAAVLPKTTAVKKSSENIADSIKQAFKNLYEKSGFGDFVNNVNKGIQKVDWSTVGDNCRSIFNNLKPIAKTALEQTQKVGKSAFGALGSHVGMFATIAGKSFQTVSGGVAKWLDNDKDKIQKHLNTIGGNLSSGFDSMSVFYDKLGTVIGGSIDRMRPFMEESISTLLSGLTDFAGGVGEIASGAFKTAASVLVDWVNSDGAVIGEFFDNLQVVAGDVMSFVGTVFSDVGTFLSNWWNGEGQNIFKSICTMFTNIGTTLMNVWNKWIMPVWEYIKKTADTVWKNYLKPVFESVFSFIGKLASYIADLWNTWLLPVVNWIVSTLAPIIKWAAGVIWSVIDSVAKFIGGIVSNIFKMLGGILDFISGVFTGNWEKAWKGISDFFSGIWNGLVSILKFPLNLLIDAINGLFKGIYSAFASVANFIGGIAKGVGSIFGQDWGWEMNADNAPQIPKLAKGGIVTAPTLALVGDNAGASSGNPEVIAPLSKLTGLINQSQGEDYIILSQILDYIKRLYEMFVVFRNNGGNVYQFTARLSGEEIFSEIIRQNELYKNRHGGVSALA